MIWTRYSAWVFVGAALGCASDDASKPQGTAGSAGSKGPSADACVQPGDKGNNFGIGTPCTPGGGECKDIVGAPVALVCLADLGQSEWFCTRIGCKCDDQCGEGAVCHIENSSKGVGSGCVPVRCGTTGSGACAAGAGGAGGASGHAGAGG